MGRAAMLWRSLCRPAKRRDLRVNRSAEVFLRLVRPCGIRNRTGRGSSTIWGPGNPTRFLWVEKSQSLTT